MPRVFQVERVESAARAADPEMVRWHGMVGADAKGWLGEKNRAEKVVQLWKNGLQLSSFTN